MKNLGRTQRHAGGGVLVTAAAQLARLKAENERYAFALRRVRDEAEDNRIAAIADDALDPKVIEHGDRSSHDKENGRG